jgi:hypothetical protein
MHKLTTSKRIRAMLIHLCRGIADCDYSARQGLANGWWSSIAIEEEVIDRRLDEIKKLMDHVITNDRVQLYHASTPDAIPPHCRPTPGQCFIPFCAAPATWWVETPGCDNLSYCDTHCPGSHPTARGLVAQGRTQLTAIGGSL